jgi:S1-C subfamily serine protease
MTVAVPLRHAPLLLAVFVTACASTQPAPPSGEPGQLGEGPTLEAPAPAPPAAVAPASCDAFLRPGVLRRGNVVRAVDRGLGQWLQGVLVTAVREAGRFQGWRVEKLYPDDPCFGSVDVRPGDVVTTVNGASLERPEQANDLFQSLRAAPALRIQLVRAGSPRTVTLQISD